MRSVTQSATPGDVGASGAANSLDPAGSRDGRPGGVGPERPGLAGAARRRSKDQPRRRRRVNLCLSEDEYSELGSGAAVAGLTPAGFATEAALAAARGDGMPEYRALRALLVELMAARTQVRRYGLNVNRAVAQFQATGETPRWLERAAAGADRGVVRLDAATDAVAGVLRRGRRQ